jgi:zinc protease
MCARLHGGCLRRWSPIAGLLGALMITVPAQAMAPIQHWVTANGARVHFVPAPDLPMVDVRVVFDGGSARDHGKPGVAQITNILLDKGAAGESADAIAARLEGLGARLGSGSLRDMAWLSLRSLSDKRHLEPAVATFTTLLSEPDFNQADFERERRRLEVAVRHQEQQPAAVAEKAYYKAVYGHHPYATPPEGDLKSLPRLTRADVVAFHDRYYAARNAVVAITGDVDREGAERLAQQVVGPRPPGAAGGSAAAGRIAEVSE